jgi:RNA polymerase sigma factor (sigma-70 family)
MPADMRNKDSELITLVRNGSKQGYKRLYNQYAGALYGVIRQMINDEQAAQKALEETLIDAWKTIGEYEGQQSFFMWLLLICRRVCKQRMRDDMEMKKEPIENVKDGKRQVEENDDDATIKL